MTQKELFYVEDAIEHERCMIAYLDDMLNCFDDESFIEFSDKEIRKHQKIEKSLLKLLEDEAHE